MRSRPAVIGALLLLCCTWTSVAEEGLASWYGARFQGRPTASGELFDPTQFTAAHRSLPFGTIVEVTHLENSRTVQVRINDRGPFVAGRILDLSHAAAEALAMLSQGVAPVRLRILEAVVPAGPNDASRPGGPGAGRESRSVPGQSGSQGTGQHGPRSTTIQVASFSTAARAVAAVTRLKEAGILAETESGPAGMTRVVIKGVSAEDIDNLRPGLAALGFPDVLIRSR